MLVTCRTDKIEESVTAHSAADFRTFGIDFSARCRLQGGIGQAAGLASRAGAIWRSVAPVRPRPAQDHTVRRLRYRNICRAAGRSQRSLGFAHWPAAQFACVARDSTSHRVRREVRGAKEFLAQDLAGMNRGKFLGHATFQW
jgi:hypothetical protein